jgi:hypothetical protein
MCARNRGCDDGSMSYQPRLQSQLCSRTIFGEVLDSHINHTDLVKLTHVWSTFPTERATDTSSPIPMAETLETTRLDSITNFGGVTYTRRIPNSVITVTLVSLAMFNFHIVGNIPVPRTASVIIFRIIIGYWR